MDLFSLTIFSLTIISVTIIFNTISHPSFDIFTLKVSFFNSFAFHHSFFYDFQQNIKSFYVQCFWVCPTFIQIITAIPNLTAFLVIFSASICLMFLDNTYKVFFPAACA